MQHFDDEDRYILPEKAIKLLADDDTERFNSGELAILRFAESRALREEPPPTGDELAILVKWVHKTKLYGEVLEMFLDGLLHFELSDEDPEDEDLFLWRLTEKGKAKLGAAGTLDMPPLD